MNGLRDVLTSFRMIRFQDTVVKMRKKILILSLRDIQIQPSTNYLCTSVWPVMLYKCKGFGVRQKDKKQSQEQWLRIKCNIKEMFTVSLETLNQNASSLFTHLQV